jgi:hypothetical protein
MLIDMLMLPSTSSALPMNLQMAERFLSILSSLFMRRKAFREISSGRTKSMAV